MSAEAGTMNRPLPWGLLPLGNDPVPIFRRQVSLGSYSISLIHL